MLRDVSHERSRMRVMRLDHLVLTVRSIEQTCAFYAGALGMQVVAFGEGRLALAFGRQKINLHPAGHEFEPKARVATPGSADLCFEVDDTIEHVIGHLERLGVAVEQGPVTRTGARGKISSVYLRDPDGNLIELASYGAAT